MSKYKPDKHWREDARLEADAFTLIVEVCDVIEVGTDRIWHQGAYRVRVTGERPQGFRAKTFIGEMAWCDAERYANDALSDAGLNFHQRVVLS